ncbi:MAG: DUF4143 domain-containing protein [Parcubacteria group bacterium]
MLCGSTNNIKVLEDTFIIKRVMPYYRNIRQEIIKANKIYFIDTGLRNVTLEQFSTWSERTDQGSLFENGVYIGLLQLLRNQPEAIHFWRTKQKSEVDFVVLHGDRPLPIEVKTSIKKGRLTSGLAAFVAKFQVRRAMLITLTQPLPRSQHIRGVALNFVSPAQLMRAVSESM